MSLSLITVNVGAPSVERARRQLEWLAQRPEDIFVLTETKATPGSQLLAEGCTAANYSVTFPEHDSGELGVMIVSKVATTPDPLTGAFSYLPARAAGVIVSTADGPYDGEELGDAARRELAEESGIMLAELGRKLWVRESRFIYRGRAHHRIEHVFLGRTPTTVAQIPLKPTENEKAGLIERRWWPATELQCCPDKLLPGNLANLLADLLNDRFSDQPLTLVG